MTTSRDLTLDVAKGLCIILMVVGHVSYFQSLNHLIYTFHMPCFFFISGWLLKEAHIKHLGIGIKKKLLGLYWPFIKWLLIFNVLHNSFITLGIITPPPYTLSDLSTKVGHTLMMNVSETLLGSFWFLKALLTISLISMISLHLWQRVCINQTYYRYGVLALIVASLLLIYTSRCTPYALPDPFSTKVWLALAFFLSGYWVCHTPSLTYWTQRKSVLVSIACFIPAIITVLLYRSGTLRYMDMLNIEEGYHVLLYFTIALLATYGILRLSYRLAQFQIAHILSYIGTKTIYILALHTLVFKGITWAYLYYQHLPLTALSDKEFTLPFPIPIGLWVAYIVLGIGVPLLCWELRHRLTRGLQARWHTWREQISDTPST